MIIFIYFAWMPIVWPSLIPSSMLTLSVFGMFVVNFYFLYSLILARIERPYREALANLVREPEKHEIFRDIWSSGREILLFFLFLSISGQRRPTRSTFSVISPTIGCGTISRMPCANWEWKRS